MSALRELLATTRFFDLPKDVGALPVDGDQHRMHIRLGNRSRTVTLFDWPDDRATAKYLSATELARTRRAYTVWAANRGLVTDARAKVP